MKDIKPILPYSHLVLFAKHWIEFPWFDNTKYCSESDFYNKVATAIAMCGYCVFNRNDVLNHVLIAVDKIREEYNKVNTSQYDFPLTNYYRLISEAQKYKAIYGINSFETALIKYCLSELSMLDIKDFAVRNIDYKSNKIKIAFRPISMTYTSCQKLFNKTFKDLLIPQSFDEQEWLKYFKKINIE